MPTTRRARAAQSEDTQSPLRSLEQEPKSRKKVSKVPKTLGKKVTDDKVTKKIAPKGRGKRPTKQTRKQAEEDLPEEMEEDTIAPEGEAAASPEVYHQEDAEAEPMEAEHSDVAAGAEEPTEHPMVEYVPSESEEEDEEDETTEQPMAEYVPSASEDEGEDEGEGETTEVPVVEYVPSGSEDGGEAGEASDDNDADGPGTSSQAVLYTKEASPVEAVGSPRPQANGYDEALDREILVSFCYYLKLSCLADADHFTISSANNSFPLYTQACSLSREGADALIRLIDGTENPVYDVDESKVPPMGMFGEETLRQLVTKKKRNAEEEAVAVDVSDEKAAPPSAFTPEHFTADEGSETTETPPRRSPRLASSTSTTEEDEVKDKSPSGSWLRRSLSKVTTSINPLSWWAPSTPHARAPIPSFEAPRTEPAAVSRNPLQERREAHLNTPVPIGRHGRAPRTEPRRSSGGARAGQSLGLFKKERKRAMALAEQQFQAREAALLVREQEFEKRRTDWEKSSKRKRDGTDEGSAATPTTYTGGRSTYSLDDASPASTESSVSGSPLATRSSLHSNMIPRGSSVANQPFTPLRAGVRDGEYMTPVASILKRGGAQTEPPNKRQRTGRSVAFKPQLEDDSPLEKHEPTKKYTPKTPYRVGSMWEHSLILKSAQRPGTSRSVLFGSSSVGQPPRFTTVTIPKSPNTISVPYDDSSDEDVEMPETPSKSLSTNVESAGSTPFTVKGIGREPPTAPQPAHASLPAATTTTTTTTAMADVAATPSTPTVVATESLQSSSLPEDQRLSKARERATQFTPKQPSRLRESESTAPAGAVGGMIPQFVPEGEDLGLPPSIMKIVQQASESEKTHPIKQSNDLFMALAKGMDIDKEVLAAVADEEIPVAIIDSVQLPGSEEFFDELGIDEELRTAVDTVWNDKSNGYAEKSMNDLDMLIKNHIEAQKEKPLFVTADELEEEL